LSPFPEYAPAALRNKWKPAATMKIAQCARSAPGCDFFDLTGRTGSIIHKDALAF
jgi:hypothetical protein